MMPGNESMSCCRSGGRCGSGCTWCSIACTSCCCSARGDRLDGGWLDGNGRGGYRLCCGNRLYTAGTCVSIWLNSWRSYWLNAWWSYWLEISCICRSWSSWGCCSRSDWGARSVISTEGRLNNRWWGGRGCWCWRNRFDRLDRSWRYGCRLHSYRLNHICSWCYSASLICWRASFNRLSSCCRSNYSRWSQICRRLYACWSTFSASFGSRCSVALDSYCTRCYGSNRWWWCNCILSNLSAKYDA